jgi:hypothetical protein
MAGLQRFVTDSIILQTPSETLLSELIGSGIAVTNGWHLTGREADLPMSPLRLNSSHINLPYVVLVNPWTGARCHHCALQIHIRSLH